MKSALLHKPSLAFFTPRAPQPPSLVALSPPSPLFLSSSTHHFCTALPNTTPAQPRTIHCHSSQSNPMELNTSTKAIAEPTLEHYSLRAAQFWEGTRDHDVSQNRGALLRNLEQHYTTPSPASSSGSGPSYNILDVGCGPGRDLMALTALGHSVTGLDGCPEFIEMSKVNCPQAKLLLQDLHKLDLGLDVYDGIFANAVLFHVHKPELPRVLRELHAALRPSGVLFVSNPRAMGPADMESGGVNDWGGDQRYGHYQTVTSWEKTCSEAGFKQLEHYCRPPGRPQEEQPWLASVWQKM